MVYPFAKLVPAQPDKKTNIQDVIKEVQEFRNHHPFQELSLHKMISVWPSGLRAPRRTRDESGYRTR